MSREVLSAVENHTQRTGPLSINLSRPGQDALIVPAVFDRRKQMPFLRCPLPGNRDTSVFSIRRQRTITLTRPVSNLNPLPLPCFILRGRSFPR